MVGGLESLVKIHNSSTVTCYWKVSKRHRSSTRRARPEPFLRLLSPGFLHWGEMNTGDVALKTPRAFFQESWKLQEQTLLSFSRVKSLSCVRLFATPRTAARQGSLSFTIYQSWLKLISIESVMLSNYIILCCPLLLPSIFPSIRVFSNESALRIRWPKVLELQFQVSPSNEYSGLISFRIDWFDLLAVQGTLKSLLQHHSSKASILQHFAFFMVQLSHPYMTTGKTMVARFNSKTHIELFLHTGPWYREIYTEESNTFPALL